MVHDTNNGMKNNYLLLLLLIGSFILLISIFLHFIIFNVPQVGLITVHGFDLLLPVLFLFGATIFGFLVSLGYYKVKFKERFSFIRKISLISTIFSILSIVSYIYTYQYYIASMDSSNGVKVSPFFSLGKGFFSLLDGSLIIILGTVLLRSKPNNFPSRWQYINTIDKKIYE